MKLNRRRGASIFSYSKRGFSILILLSSLILGGSNIGLAAEAAQVTTVVVPMNLAFPLLPSLVILVSNPGTKTESMGVVESGSDGVAGIIRISGHD